MKGLMLYFLLGVIGYAFEQQLWLYGKHPNRERLIEMDADGHITPFTRAFSFFFCILCGPISIALPTVALIQRAWVTRKLSKVTPPPEPQHFGFGVIARHHVPCTVCGKGVVDAGSILWTEDDRGLRSNYCHARCAIRVVRLDGGIYDANGARLDEPFGANPFGLYLTPTEWEQFKESYLEAMKTPIDIDAVE